QELVGLMNCAIRGARLDVPADSPAAFSVLNYGNPPLLRPGDSNLDPARIAAHIRETMRRFEPRVSASGTQVRIRSDTDRSSAKFFYFDIATTARTDGSAIKIGLKLNYLNGFFCL